MSEIKSDKLSPRTDSGTTTLGDSGDTFLVNTGAKLDINGTELILDADADTSITADTDDQIDIRIAGADDFQFTANTFTAAASSIVALDDGAVGTPALTNTGDLNTGIYFPAADTVGVVTGGTEQFRFGSNPIPGGGNKNMAINGNMNIYQRGLSAYGGGSQTGLGAAKAYTQVDMFHLFCWNTAGRVTADRYNMTAAETQATGQGHALHIDVTTADASVASDEIMMIRQTIEAQNCQHLQWGSAAAKDITLQFWMKSPKSGTHCVSLYQSDDGRGYIREFTMASADTWEQFKITFPGDTTGEIDNNINAGLNIDWPLTTNTGNEGSADSWLSTAKSATSNQQNLLDSTSNNVYLTGVQLEVGSVATDFAHEDTSTTLAKCQRYFWSGGIGATGGAISTSQAIIGVVFPVTMRAAPTASLTTGHSGTASSFYVAETGGGGMVGAPNAIYSSTMDEVGCQLYVNGWSGGNALTQHRPLVIYNYSIMPFNFTAEL
jgi:hypothetical protein